MDSLYGAQASLGSTLENIESFDDDLILFTYGKGPVTCETEVFLVEDEEEAPVGTRYFLEVFVVKDVLRVWSQWRGGAQPTREDKSAAVIHYATNDAYLPPPE